MRKGFLSSDDPKQSKIRPPQRQAPRTPEGKLTFDHFELERLLGCGNFSKVFEVTEKGTSNTYALKVFNRSDVIRLNKIDDVRMERHAMLRLNEPGHPNIIKLIETFKDEFRVCFLYELAEGGELWEHVKFAGLLNKQSALSVITQLVCAVEYLHSKNIVHRDLKAENIVLTKDGVVKLIDLGSAMDLDHPEVAAPGLGSISPSFADSAGGRSNYQRQIRRPAFKHYVGTPQFMPPEAIKNKDSGKLRDLWSLGCTIYQILTGSPPFSGSTDYFVLLRVEAGGLEYPPDMDLLARDLIEKLTVSVPCKRIGSKDFEEIKKHPFFPLGCFERSIRQKRVYPALQEICMQILLKRYHSLLADALEDLRKNISKATDCLAADEQAERERDKERRRDRDSGGDSCSQDMHATDTRKRIDAEAKRKGKGEREGEGGGERGREKEAWSDGGGEGEREGGSEGDVGRDREEDTAKDAEREMGKGRDEDTDGERGKDKEGCLGMKQAEELLDRLVPRHIRERKRDEMSPHMQVLIDRLQFCLHSRCNQFARECKLAEEWRQRHQQQVDSADEDD